MKITVIIALIIFTTEIFAEDKRDYLDCIIKRIAKFEKPKKKFFINFVINLPKKNDIDKEKFRLELDKKWIKTEVTLDLHGTLHWKVKETDKEAPHPEMTKKLDNFSLDKPFEINEKLVRELSSTEIIKYRLTCH